MIRWIIAASLRNKVLVLALAAGLVFFGAVQIRDMPVDVLPEFSPPRVEIQTEALGLSAVEVEQLITVPLEADLLNGVPFLDELRSKSMPGLSSIELIFEPGTDLLAARQVVQEQMTQAHALPNVSKPPAMLQPVSSTSRVVMVGLSSDDMSVIEMSVLARWQIRPRLMAVPGVANVAIWGQQDRQLQVLVDPERLRAADVRLLDIISTAGNALAVSPLTFLEASTPGTGGFIDTPNQRLGIQHVLPIITARDLSRVTLEGRSEGGLRLGDVTRVVEGHQPLIGDAVVHDGPGLVLVIEKFPNANTLQVTRSLEAAFEDMAPGLTGIDIDTTIYRPATYIEVSIDNVTTALLVGFLLLALILSAFLYQWRAVVISLLTIPIALLAAGAVLYLRDVTFNTMMLAGLVIGLSVIVDDAVVDIDNIMRRLREGGREEDSDKSTASIILEAAAGIRRSLVFATLIVLVALAPLVFVGGRTGELLRPVALSYALAIVVSTVVAVTVTPALTLILFGNAPMSRRGSPLLPYIKRKYAALLARVVHQPWPAYAAIGASVLVAVAALPFLGASLTPPFRESQLLVRWDGVPGTSEPEMQRITTRASRELRSIPGVTNVGAHIGRALLSDEVVDVNSGELWVSVDPEADYDSTVAAVREVVEGYPGVSGNVQTYLSGRLKEPDTQEPDQDVVVRVFGPNMDVLAAKAAEVKQLLAGVDGVVDESVELPIEEPSIQVRVDLADAARHGIKPGDVRRSAGTYINGLEVGSLYEQQKVFEVVVRGAPRVRDSVTSVENLVLDTPQGGHVRLGDVASVSLEAAPPFIEHRDVSRSLDVTANVSGRDLGAVLSQVRADLKGLDFPLEYHAEVLDASASRQSLQHLLLIGLAVLIGVLLLLQACFGSWRLAALVLLALPMTLSGGLLASLVAGRVLTIGAFAGFFAVLAIASRHGIVLVRLFQQQERHDGQTLGRDLVLRGARERFGPTLIATLAIGMSLLPVAVAGDKPGFEILRPLALVVLGGLITSALVNLFVLPALYLRFALPSPEVAATSQPGSVTTQ